MTLRILLAALVAVAPIPLLAGPPEIVKVEVSHPSMGWRFDVTLRHDDTGWDHYADGWEVTDAAGNRLGFRKLHHPHVHEQPFTRSLTGVMLPDGIREVHVRARCSEHGWGDTTHKVELEPSDW